MNNYCVETSKPHKLEQNKLCLTNQSIHFLHNYVESSVRWEIIQFFNQIIQARGSFMCNGEESV